MTGNVKIESAIVDWASGIPLEQIAPLMAFLAARLLTEKTTEHKKELRHSAQGAEQLLTANGLAECLGVPESWVRTEERTGRIPGVRLGKYVRFKLSEVERVLAERQHETR
jgi:excisionase family DNA binding protein